MEGLIFGILRYAVAVKNESGQIVGHVPIEISKIMCKFIRDCAWRG